MMRAVIRRIIGYCVFISDNGQSKTDEGIQNLLVTFQEKLQSNSVRILHIIIYKKQVHHVNLQIR